MSRSPVPRIAMLSLLAVVACSDTREPPPSLTGPLKPGVVARVGNVDIPASLVKDVAQARKISPREATTLLVEDTLLAQAAHDQKLDADLRVAAKVRAAKARASLNQLLSQQPSGPATDEQTAEMTRELWAQVDREEARRVAHAVVLASRFSKQPSPPDSPEDNERRRMLAEKIRDAVAHASSPAEFGTLAEAVPHDDLQVKVEALPPMVADGRGFDGNSFAPAFAQGAFAVPEGEQVSAVVPSDFGWHVIYVIERLPPVHQSLEERRALATRILAEKSMKTAYDAHTAELRKQLGVEISTAAETDMMSTPSAPPP